jgi:hypothetical protein
MATWGTILAEIEDEYDLTEEVFIDANELLTYGNDAIEFIESKLVSSNEQYFLASTTASTANGTATISFPSDIYANKIRGLFYDYNNTKYEVRRIKDLRETLDIQAGDLYKYLITNVAADGTKIKLYPTPSAAETAALTIWYVRNVTRFVDSTTELDVPEAKAFIKQFVIDKAVNKERMTPDAPLSPKCERLLQELLDALAMMTPDEDNEVPMDLTYYEDSNGFDNGGYY